jgi:hypothetical protein
MGQGKAGHGKARPGLARQGVAWQGKGLKILSIVVSLTKCYFF